MENSDIEKKLKAIERIKSRIAKLNELRPGKISEQYNVCGTKGCRCKAIPPQKHGPYYQLSYTLQKRGTTRSIYKEDLPRIRLENESYFKLKELVESWVVLATEVSDLRTAENKSKR
jgi:hypothetical protein